MWGMPKANMLAGIAWTAADQEGRWNAGVCLTFSAQRRRFGIPLRTDSKPDSPPASMLRLWALEGLDESVARFW